MSRTHYLLVALPVLVFTTQFPLSPGHARRLLGMTSATTSTATIHLKTPGTAVASPTPVATVASTALPTPSAVPFPPPTSTPVPPGAGFWHTNGSRVVDQAGRTVRIAALTWYGMETTYWVPAGLDYQPFTEIMNMVKGLGYNAIRLAYSDELVQRNPVVTQHVGANRWFHGMHALAVLDAIVGYAQHIGLKIILDDHRSQAASPKQVNILDEPLWYTRQYPESVWIRDLQTLARRYRKVDAVIGFDLRNEPHTNGPGPWNLHAYLDQGATWGPFRGHDNPATDWRLAAERAGNAVLAVNPHLLIFVEGVQLYPDPTQPNGTEAYWWGSILSPVAHYPVQLAVPHQLVYSAHDWGPRKHAEPWFRTMSYAGLQKIWYHNWSFIFENVHASYVAPVWIGEFGTCTDLASCVNDPKSAQAQWFHDLLRFLHDHPQVGWGFFALNGTNANNHVTDNGLLNGTWDQVASLALQRDLATIQH